MKNKRLVYWACIACASGWTTANAQTPTTQTSTNGLVVSRPRYEPGRTFIETEIPTDVPTLQTAYTLQFEADVRRNYLDSFGPASALQWMSLEQSGGYKAVDAVSIVGRSVVKRAFVDSLRQTMIDSFAPVGDWYTWANDFVIGTVADVSEERLTQTAPTGAAPIASASEESWWTQMQRDDKIAYGVRPFNAHPYAYASAVLLGDAREPIMLADVRCHYDLLRPKVTMEGFFLFPVTEATSINVGMSYHHNLLDSSDPNDEIDASIAGNHKLADGNGNLSVSLVMSNIYGAGIQGSFSCQF